MGHAIVLWRWALCVGSSFKKPAPRGFKELPLSTLTQETQNIYKYFIIIEMEHNSFKTHQYLNQIKTIDQGFMEMYEDCRDRYHLV